MSLPGTPGNAVSSWIISIVCVLLDSDLRTRLLTIVPSSDGLSLLFRELDLSPAAEEWRLELCRRNRWLGSVSTAGGNVSVSSS